jgi:hypothetical protein
MFNTNKKTTVQTVAATSGGDAVDVKPTDSVHHHRLYKDEDSRASTAVGGGSSFEVDGRLPKIPPTNIEGNTDAGTSKKSHFKTSVFAVAAIAVGAFFKELFADLFEDFDCFNDVDA